MIFRVSRHTTKLKALQDFYTTILCLELLASFENHDNYDGIFLGKQGQTWHLEFTQSTSKADHRFDQDDALVFYPETKNEYNAIILNIGKHNIVKYTPRNPYWQENGILIKDPDGYGIIISKQKVVQS